MHVYSTYMVKVVMHACVLGKAFLLCFLSLHFLAQFTTARSGTSLVETTPTFTGTTLEFESRFESGNLGKAVQV